MKSCVLPMLMQFPTLTVYDLLYLAYVQKGMGIEEGKEFVKEKLKRSFQKLSPESQKYYRSKFQKVMEVLN